MHKILNPDATEPTQLKVENRIVHLDGVGRILKKGEKEASNYPYNV